jgi:hypothetical protein
VLGSASLEVFGEVPIKQLRSDALTELDLTGNSLGPTEAIVLAKLVEVSSVLTWLNLEYNQIGDGKAALRRREIANGRHSHTLELEL